MKWFLQELKEFFVAAYEAVVVKALGGPLILIVILILALIGSA